jgi:hypothetical protein
VICWISFALSPKIFDPEVITVEEDSNVCNTKLAVIAEILVKPVKVAVVAPKSISVVPIITLSFANLALVILPSCTVPAKLAKEDVADVCEAVVALSANDAVAKLLNVVALAATEAESDVLASLAKLAKDAVAKLLNVVALAATEA